MKSTIDRDVLLEVVSNMTEINKESIIATILSMPDAFENEQKEIIEQYDMNQKMFSTRLSLVEQLKASNSDANTVEVALKSATSFRDRADGIRDIMCILKM